MKFECAQCKKPVPEVNGKPVKACSCKAPIVAYLRARATGQSKVAG